jgi:SAM-dependent methyltransferase
MQFAGMTSLVAMGKTDPAQAAEELSRSDLEGLDYVERNRTAWERWAPGYAAAGRKAWQDELRWGIWGIPESEARLLEGIEPRADVIELGCGTAAISACLSRLGMQPIGVDIVRAQLETAAQLEREFGISFGLLCANAEKLHFEDASFDLAISEYGASLWCDPLRWLPEAHRLLRPNGRLIFITNSPLLMACTPEEGGPAEDRLVRDYFSAYQMEFPGDGAVEFHLTHGQWVRLLSAIGFVLENLIEVQAPPEAKTDFDFASLEWARRWPSEDIWVLRKAS